MMVINIDIFESHPFQALIQTGDEIFFRAPFSIRAWPHVVPCFGRDDDFVAVRQQIILQNFTEGFLGGTGRRPIVVRQIKVCNTQIKGSSCHRSSVLVLIYPAKIMPESKRNRRQLKPAFSTSAICHHFVSFVVCYKYHIYLSFYSDMYSVYIYL
ncbi:hypothetical protein D3C78_976670 [compost metagenome]